MKAIKIKDFIFLHICFLVYTFNTICSKFAALQPMFSFKWILWYGGVIGILFVYAIMWQQSLKKMPLTFAYANKAITVIWGIILGAIIFSEGIKLNMIIGAVVIVIGIYLVVTGEEA